MKIGQVDFYHQTSNATRTTLLRRARSPKMPPNKPKPSLKDLLVFSMCGEFASTGNLVAARNALDSLDHPEQPADFLAAIRGMRVEVMSALGEHQAAIELLDALLAADGMDPAKKERLRFQRGSCLFALSKQSFHSDTEQLKRALDDLDAVLGPRAPAQVLQTPFGSNAGDNKDSVHSILESLGQPVGSNPSSGMGIGMGTNMPMPGFGGGQFNPFPSDPFSPPQRVTSGLTDRERLIATGLRGLVCARLVSGAAIPDVSRDSAVADLTTFSRMHGIIFSPPLVDPMSMNMGMSMNPGNGEQEGGAAKEKLEGTAEKLLAEIQMELARLSVS